MNRIELNGTELRKKMKKKKKGFQGKFKRTDRDRLTDRNRESLCNFWVVAPPHYVVSVYGTVSLQMGHVYPQAGKLRGGT